MNKKSIPILPLRDIVVFPGMVAPLFVGRKLSVNALNHVMTDDKKIFLVTQKDSDVENPIWESGGLPTSINTYPFDATGLSPGSTYRWKIRLNPEGEPGPWSDIYNFSIVNYSLDEPPAGQIINTVNPVFNFSGPIDLAGYELRISNSEDSEVESGNIFKSV